MGLQPGPTAELRSLATQQIAEKLISAANNQKSSSTNSNKQLSQTLIQKLKKYAIQYEELEAKEQGLVGNSLYNGGKNNPENRSKYRRRIFEVKRALNITNNNNKNSLFFKILTYIKEKDKEKLEKEKDTCRKW